MSGMGTTYKRGNVWWVSYYRNNQQIRESSGSELESDAKTLLRTREGDIARGIPISRRVTQTRMSELLSDVVRDYKLNNRRSLPDLKRRIKLHLEPAFDKWKASLLTTNEIRAYTLNRKEAGASNGEINRELAILKRAFTLAIQNGKLVYRPHIPMLKESNVRKGFFEYGDYRTLLGHLPEWLRPFITTAYITGWRMGELRSLEWRHVDLDAGELISLL